MLSFSFGELKEKGDGVENNDISRNRDGLVGKPLSGKSPSLDLIHDSSRTAF